MSKNIGINKVPNNYIYTSHTGAEYIFLEGQWFKCSNMDVVQNVHTFKMNQSAIKQINESNSTSKLKVGSVYMVNESKYVYVGRNHFSINGNLLQEDISSKLVNLFEADSDSTPPAPPAPNGTDVPNGFIYTSGKGKSYIKRQGKWYDVSTKKVLNSSATASLDRAAIAQIDRINSSEAVKIGQEFKSKSGVVYRYVGNSRFISDDGKLLPSSTAKNILDRLNAKASDENNDSGSDSSESGSADQESPPAGQNQGQGNSSNDSNSNRDDSESPFQALANSIKSNPQAGRIVALISRGDEVSLLAADILLAGQQKEVQQIINSLNTVD